MRRTFAPAAVLLAVGLTTLVPTVAAGGVSTEDRTLSLEERVHFLGRVPTADLLYLYNASQMLVLPSYYEGFGLPPLEAMACDIPVIVSDTSVMPEVVGDAALRVAHEDVEGFTVAMWRLLTDHDLRADMIAKGRKRVRCFSWERAARETREVYQRVAERRNSV